MSSKDLSALFSIKICSDKEHAGSYDTYFMKHTINLIADGASICRVYIEYFIQDGDPDLFEKKMKEFAPNLHYIYTNVKKLHENNTISKNILATKMLQQKLKTL